MNFPKVLTSVLGVLASGWLVLLALAKMEIIGVGSETALKSNMTIYETLLTTYRELTGDYPTTEQGLEALAVRPVPAPANWRKLRESIDKDPWGRPLVYRCPGKRHPGRFDLFSQGKDGLPDTADDIWLEARY